MSSRLSLGSSARDGVVRKAAATAYTEGSHEFLGLLSITGHLRSTCKAETSVAKCSRASAVAFSIDANNAVHDALASHMKLLVTARGPSCSLRFRSASGSPGQSAPPSYPLPYGVHAAHSDSLGRCPVSGYPDQQICPPWQTRPSTSEGRSATRSASSEREFPDVCAAVSTCFNHTTVSFLLLMSGPSGTRLCV